MKKDNGTFWEIVRETDDKEDKLALNIYLQQLKGRISLIFDMVELIFTGGIRYFIMLKRNLKKGELKESAYKSICEFVPKVIENGTILSFYDLLASPSWLTESEIEDHFSRNIETWQVHINDFLFDDKIIDQTKFSRIPLFFGKKSNGEPQTADFNTCGVIGLFNVLSALNNKSVPNFPKLLKSFEEHGIALNGAFGVSPNAIYEYLSMNGYDARILSGKKPIKKNLQKLELDYDAYIVTVYNNSEDLSEMMHTMAITKSDSETDQKIEYILNNDYSPYETENAPVGLSRAESIEALLNNYQNKGGHHCRPICIIGVRQRIS